MSLRIYWPDSWQAGDEHELPESQSRHVQVMRMQPGDRLVIFPGDGTEWVAEVTEMGRRHVRVRFIESSRPDRELPRAVTLAVCMPANDRMDGIVEKATELGVACIQPLMSERSVLRISGDRAVKRQLHWQGVAVSAAEQCGRVQVPRIEPIMNLREWLGRPLPAQTQGLVLSPYRQQRMSEVLDAGRCQVFLSGPEGGLSEQEEQSAFSQGYDAVCLGPRILRADTAPLLALGLIGSM